MKSKKSLISMDVMIKIIIGVLVLLVIIMVVRNLIEKGGDETNTQVGRVNDLDGDGIANFFDKCPKCHGDDDNRGCPSNIVDLNDPDNVDLEC